MITRREVRQGLGEKDQSLNRENAAAKDYTRKYTRDRGSGAQNGVQDQMPVAWLLKGHGQGVTVNDFSQGSSELARLPTFARKRKARWASDGP